MKMKTEVLIQDLAAGLKPVETIRFSFLDFFKIFSVGILCVLLALGVFGLRNDFSQQIQSLHFWVDLLLILMSAVLTILVAFKLSIPSLENQKLYFLPFTVFFLILISTGTLFLTDEHASHYSGHGLACVAEILAMTAIPSAILFYFVRKAAVIQREIVGVLVILAGLSFGLLAVQLTCADATPLHLLLWHLLPSVIVAGCGFYFAKRAIKKI